MERTHSAYLLAAVACSTAVHAVQQEKSTLGSLQPNAAFALAAIVDRGPLSLVSIESIFHLADFATAAIEYSFVQKSGYLLQTMVLLRFSRPILCAVLDPPAFSRIFLCRNTLLANDVPRSDTVY